MGNAIGTQRLILEREDEEYVWKFSAILEPIISTPDERKLSFINVVSDGDGGEIFPVNSQGAATTTTMHRGFQPIATHHVATATNNRHRQEINPAPLIFAALMIGVAAFHGWGFYQYYRGSIDSQMECKR